MNIGELTDAGAVQQAMHEFDGGRDAFLSEHHFGPADQYYVQFNTRLYDANAIAGVAYGRQFSDRGTLPHGGFNGGVAGANAALRAIGFEIVNTKPDTIEGAWRLAVQAHFGATAGDAPLEPSTLRRFGVYGGAQGVWVLSERTQPLDDRGRLVGVLHTGLH